MNYFPQHQKKKNLFYIQSQAEKLPIGNNKIDLICIAQALHWFSLNEFYSEVKRILQPNGIIAAWCYNQSIINHEVDKVIHKTYYLVTNKENLTLERKYVYEHYQTILFPFDKIDTPQFELTVEWSFIELFGYLKTWPSILEYEKKFGKNVLMDFEEDLKEAWGNIDIKKIIRWPIHLLIGQV